jgi:uncharacterized protein YkwD
MRRRSVLLCTLVCLLAAASSTFVSGGAAARTATGVQRETALEQAVLLEVNRLRQVRGLRQLTLSTALQAAASFQTRDMLAHGYFEHEQPGGVSFGDRLKRFYPLISGASWTVGENLLWSSPTISAPDAVKLWLASPPHRRNLYDPAWREVGVGAFSAPSASGSFSSAQGPVVVVTMDFGSRTGGRAPAAAKHP